MMESRWRKIPRGRINILPREQRKSARTRLSRSLYLLDPLVYPKVAHLCSNLVTALASLDVDDFPHVARTGFIVDLSI